MNDVEQIIAALIYKEATSRNGSKFRGSVAQLHEATIVRYRLNSFENEFLFALKFWESKDVARFHRYEGVKDHVIIDGSNKMIEAVFDVNRQSKAMGVKTEDPYPIINSYFDLGDSWLHDMAIALRDRSEDAPEKNPTVHSSSWTGRYVVSQEERERVCNLLKDLEASVEESELSNTERANAMALVKAAQALTDAPDPFWSVVLQILSSPVLANFTSIAALIVAIIKS